CRGLLCRGRRVRATYESVSGSCDRSFFFYRDAPHRALHSFPTRRSSDLFVLTFRQRANTAWDIFRRLRSLLMPPPSTGLGIKRRSEEHTSELQSRFDLVCRLLLEKKKTHPPQVTSLQRPQPPCLGAPTSA